MMWASKLRCGSMDLKVRMRFGPPFGGSIISGDGCICGVLVGFHSKGAVHSLPSRFLVEAFCFNFGCDIRSGPQREGLSGQPCMKRLKSKGNEASMLARLCSFGPKKKSCVSSSVQTQG